MTARWRAGRFHIATTAGRQEMEGRMRGWFGLHPVYCDVSGRSWNVTHLPTGRAIGTAIPNLSSAQRYCAEIEHLADWKSVTAETPFPEPLKPILREARMGYPPPSSPTAPAVAPGRPSPHDGHKESHPA